MVSDLMARYPTISSVEQSFDAVVDFLAQNKRAIYHIYNSVSRADLPEIGGDIVLHAAVKPVNDGAKAGAAVKPHQHSNILRRLF